VTSQNKLPEVVLVFVPIQASTCTTEVYSCVRRYKVKNARLTTVDLIKVNFVSP